MSEDPTYNINASGDIEQMLKELGTEKGKEAALLGGGGTKAQNERVAALADLLLARYHIKEGSKSSTNGDGTPAYRATSDDKIVARIAMHKAGERAPVNGKMVKSCYITGDASRSFTSTSYDPLAKNEFEYIKVEKNPKKKGYVQLHTTHGDLSIELHYDIAPRVCENFATLCESGYYNETIFHRSIRNFMIQGGDPTGTGKGGKSIWGKPFADEDNSKSLQSDRGVCFQHGK